MVTITTQSSSPPRVRRRRLNGPLRGGADYWHELQHLALSTGLHAVGVAPVNEMLHTREQLHHRIDQKLVNGMQFTFRDPHRSTTPEKIVAGAQSMIVAALSYAAVDDADDMTDAVEYRARVARYAWADYQQVLKDKLTVVSNQLRHDGHAAVVFADDNALVDREAAKRAGLGWYGKNANILIEGSGSFFVLGSVVTTADLPFSAESTATCGTCTRCLPACPTGAIGKAGVIDANKCLSWLLQKPGVFDRQYRVALNDRIYGCDDCQTACPPTQRKSVPVKITGTALRYIDALWILDASDEELMKRCDPWYVHQRNPLWLRRNALVILANIGHPKDERVVETLRANIATQEPVLRAHAVWAAARLGLVSLFSHLDNAKQDAMVRDELENLPTLRGDL